MKKDRLLTALFILMLVAGLSLLLYPAVSNYINSYRQAQLIGGYTGGVSEMEQGRYDEILSAAQNYNAQLADGKLNAAQRAEVYDQLLDPFSTGVMGYIEIPSINCRLPVGHGTEDGVLDDSVGHVDWSSLPVGGESTHCVLSGHRGLPSAELLTNIDHMQVGDRFSIHVLDLKLEYQVDQICVVLPEDASELMIVPGEDYVTLLTCTPYGINSHRLLVRGKRISSGTGEDDPVLYVANEVEKISPVYTIPVLMAGGLVIGLVGFWINGQIKRVRKKTGRAGNGRGEGHGKVKKTSL